MTNEWRLGGTPYEVQVRALKSAAGKECFAYFMEMGLGKTATVLAEAASLWHDQKIDGVIVVCPNSLKATWLEEAEKWEAPCCLGEAWPNLSPEPDFYTILLQGYFLYTINYEAIITKRGFDWATRLLRENRVMLVLDESVQIKNPRAKRTKALHRLGKFATVRRILSGQPIVQGPQDLWAQMHFIDAFPAAKMNYYAWRNHFCVMGGWQGKQIVGQKNKDQLSRYVAECSFRAKKDDWLPDLPKKIYATRTIELVGRQREIYDEMRKGFIALIDGDTHITAPMVITQMLKLQQIGSGFIIDEEGKPHNIVDPKHNPKLEAVLEVVEETTGKVLVFTFFRHSAELLHDAIPGSMLIMAGYHTDATRDPWAGQLIQGMVRDFNASPVHRVMIVQVQTGKYGLTILGGPGDDRCATTIFYENSFSLDARIQAEDRNHRIGQDQPVVYVDLIASEIDKRAVRALTKKQDVARAVLDGMRGKDGTVRGSGSRVL